jgi:hypothetical protein
LDLLAALRLAAVERRQDKGESRMREARTEIRTMREMQEAPIRKRSVRWR